MNTTIININNNTMDFNVRKYAQMLIKGEGKLFHAVFRKKNGELRNMVFTTSANWDSLNGITPTPSGKQMVSTKCQRNMATVCERLEDGHFQPRTLNFATIISLEPVNR